mgnify:CR=1 FL=1
MLQGDRIVGTFSVFTVGIVVIVQVGWSQRIDKPPLAAAQHLLLSVLLQSHHALILAVFAQLQFVLFVFVVGLVVFAPVDVAQFDVVQIFVAFVAINLEDFVQLLGLLDVVVHQRIVDVVALCILLPGYGAY